MRNYSNTDIKYIECINNKLNKWRIRWDIQPEYQQNEEGNQEEKGVSFLEYEFNHKPSLDEIKDVVLKWYNDKIDAQIYSGFIWKDMPVWLSKENQFNYKAAFDLAVQTNSQSLPVTFKFGSEYPIYYTFETVDELTDFYQKAMNHVTTTLTVGWSLKDSLDWSVYNID